MASCKRCGAQVVWCKTESSGRMMPLDPEPRADGNVVKVGNEESTSRQGRVVVVPVVRVLGKYEDTNRLRFVAHFATCVGRPANQARVERSING